MCLKAYESPRVGKRVASVAGERVEDRTVRRFIARALRGHATQDPLEALQVPYSASDVGNMLFGYGLDLRARHTAAMA